MSLRCPGSNVGGLHAPTWPVAIGSGVHKKVDVRKYWFLGRSFTMGIPIVAVADGAWDSAGTRRRAPRRLERVVHERVGASRATQEGRRVYAHTLEGTRGHTARAETATTAHNVRKPLKFMKILVSGIKSTG